MKIFMTKWGRKVLAMSFLCFLGVALSQETKFDKRAYKSALRDGDLEYERDRFRSALEIYLEAYELKTDDPYLNFRIGACYINTTDRLKAYEYLKYAEDKDPDVSYLLDYFLAKVFHSKEEFEKALSYYDSFLTKLDEKNDGEGDKRRRVSRDIQVTKNAMQAYKSPREVELIHLGSRINSSAIDHSPVLSADENLILFTSRRKESLQNNRDINGLYSEDIYMSRKVDGEWTEPENVSTVNTIYNEATVNLSPNGKKLLIFVGNVGMGDIFICDFTEEGKWSKPKPFPKQISSPDAYEPSATISNDGQTIIFSSNREDGYGGLDLYIAQKNEKGKWGDAENLGPEINSPYDDDAPFLDIDGKVLYFSSEGHNSIGYLDIFKTELNEETTKWGEPENLGYPINSVGDDVYFVLSGDGRHAYLSTVNGESVGDQDIYKLKLEVTEDYEDRLAMVEEITGTQMEKEEVLEEIVEEIISEPVTLEVSVVDAITLEPIQAAVQIIQKSDSDVLLKTESLEGMFQAEFLEQEEKALSIYAEAEGYVYRSLDVTIPAAGEETQVIKRILKLKKVEQEVNVVKVIRNIYFDFDKHSLKESSYTELDKIKTVLAENPSMNIEIAGHCDFKGENGYNVGLSKMRAAAVSAFLVENGISSDRISTVGYGEARPLASNDDPYTRELNRRVEFVLKK